jgi:hypothetical protein
MKDSEIKNFLKSSPNKKESKIDKRIVRNKLNVLWVKLQEDLDQLKTILDTEDYWK